MIREKAKKRALEDVRVLSQKKKQLKSKLECCLLVLF